MIRVRPSWIAAGAVGLAVGVAAQEQLYRARSHPYAPVNGLTAATVGTLVGAATLATVTAMRDGGPTPVWLPLLILADGAALGALLDSVRMPSNSMSTFINEVENDDFMRRHWARVPTMAGGAALLGAAILALRPPAAATHSLAARAPWALVGAGAGVAAGALFATLVSSGDTRTFDIGRPATHDLAARFVRHYDADASGALELGPPTSRAPLDLLQLTARAYLDAYPNPRPELAAAGWVAAAADLRGDADGVATVAEVEARFAAYDVDHDGTIDQSEWAPLQDQLTPAA